jgi:hypothetical protein
MSLIKFESPKLFMIVDKFFKSIKKDNKLIFEIDLLKDECFDFIYIIGFPFYHKWELCWDRSPSPSKDIVLAESSLEYADIMAELMFTNEKLKSYNLAKNNKFGIPLVTKPDELKILTRHFKKLQLIFEFKDEPDEKQYRVHIPMIIEARP